jgi:hypothetical protein
MIRLAGVVVSDLRTRIANAAWKFAQPDIRNFPEPPRVFFELADAVIAELGLTRVTRSERVPIHRYVTDWKADDE